MTRADEVERSIRMMATLGVEGTATDRGEIRVSQAGYDALRALATYPSDDKYGHRATFRGIPVVIEATEHKEINTLIDELSVSTPVSRERMTAAAREYPDIGFLRALFGCWQQGYNFRADDLWLSWQDPPVLR